MTTEIIPAPQPLVSMPARQLARAESGLDVRSCPSLSQSLAQARDRCKAAAKDAKNTHHGYAYASADEVIATASEAMHGSGLALLPASQELVVMGTGSMAVYALNRTVVLSHASGEYLPLELRGWPVVPERGRPLDKAYAIALTTSLAYMLRDLLQMPRGTGDDAAAQDDTRTPLPPPPAHAGGVDPNAPAPAVAPTTATPATINSEQYQALVGLVRQRGRSTQEVQMLLASRNLKVLEHLPVEHLGWATQILIDGQASTDQCDRIAALVESRKLSWDSIHARLQQRYGVDRLRLLTTVQAEEVEQALRPR